MQYYSLIFLTHLLFSIMAEGSSEVIHEPNYSYNEDYEGTKEMSYDDTEGNLTAAYDQTSEVLSVTSFMFTYTKGILHVTFTPAFVGQNYAVFLETDVSTLQMKTIIAEPVVNLTYGRHDIFEATYLCIRIVCFCKSQEFRSEPFLLKAYKTEELDCRSWNVNVSLHAFPSNYSINVVFVPTSNYELCFKNYTVELFRCNETCQQGDASFKKIKEAVYNNSVVTVTFEELSSSNYSAMITPKHWNCLDNICGQRRTSESVELSEPKITVRTKPLLPKNEKVDLIAVIIPLSIMAVVVTIGVIAARKLKDCPMYKLHAFKSSHGQEDFGKTAGNEETIIISILHAQSIELEREVVLALYDFLKDCCKVHPVTAEKNPEVFINPTGWIQKNFNYNQLLNERVIHKVLIVETDAAGKLYEHWKNLGEGSKLMPTYQDYSRLNWIFPRGLTELFASPDFFGVDHYRILVVSFPYCKKALSCFKQKRLHLPDQTVELYNSLWNKRNLLHDEEYLKDKWRENEAYKRLLKTIEEMENYVAENENYLDNCVFGQKQTV